MPAPRRRLRRVQPARARVPDRRDPQPGRLRSRRLSPQPPRFQGENFARNLALVDLVRDIAAGKDCTPAQLALAWVLAQGPDIVPIPGTKRRKYLDENLDALDVRLSAQDRAAIEAALPRGEVRGARYTAGMMALTGR